MTEHLPECLMKSVVCEGEFCHCDYAHFCNCNELRAREQRSGGLITRHRAEQIGRNIGQYGCVITEQRHLPECPMLEPYSADTTQHCFCTRKNPCIHDEMECICDRLRACEERVAEETEAAMMEFFHSKPSPPHDQHHFADNICAYCVGYQEAFTEAEKFYTNSCLFCGYAGEWSTWVCDDCKKEREEEDMGYISD